MDYPAARLEPLVWPPNNNPLTDFFRSLGEWAWYWLSVSFWLFAGQPCKRDEAIERMLLQRQSRIGRLFEVDFEKRHPSRYTIKRAAQWYSVFLNRLGDRSAVIHELERFAEMCYEPGILPRYRVDYDLWRAFAIYLGEFLSDEIIADLPTAILSIPDERDLDSFGENGELAEKLNRKRRFLIELMLYASEMPGSEAEEHLEMLGRGHQSEAISTIAQEVWELRSGDRVAQRIENALATDWAEWIEFPGCEAYWIPWYNLTERRRIYGWRTLLFYRLRQLRKHQAGSAEYYRYLNGLRERIFSSKHCKRHVLEASLVLNDIQNLPEGVTPREASHMLYVLFGPWLSPETDSEHCHLAIDAFLDEGYLSVVVGNYTELRRPSAENRLGRQATYEGRLVELAAAIDRSEERYLLVNIARDRLQNIADSRKSSASQAAAYVVLYNLLTPQLRSSDGRVLHALTSEDGVNALVEILNRKEPWLHVDWVRYLRDGITASDSCSQYRWRIYRALANSEVDPTDSSNFLRFYVLFKLLEPGLNEIDDSAVLKWLLSDNYARHLRLCHQHHDALDADQQTQSSSRLAKISKTLANMEEAGGIDFQVLPGISEISPAGAEAEAIFEFHMELFKDCLTRESRRMQGWLWNLALTKSRPQLQQLAVTELKRLDCPRPNSKKANALEAWIPPALEEHARLQLSAVYPEVCLVTCGRRPSSMRFRREIVQFAEQAISNQKLESLILLLRHNTERLICGTDVLMPDFSGDEDSQRLISACVVLGILEAIGRGEEELREQLIADPWCAVAWTLFNQLCYGFSSHLSHPNVREALLQSGPILPAYSEHRGLVWVQERLKA